MTRNQKQNLIPTPITDKNGKLTTVHKKPQTLHSAESKIPAPTPPMNDLSELRCAVETRVQELYDKNHDSTFDYSAYLKKEVQSYPERTLKNIDLATRNDGPLAQCVAEDIVHGEEQTLISATIHYYLRSGSTDYRRTALDVRTLINYAPFRNYRDIGDVDEHTQKQCLAMMKFTQLTDTMPAAESPFLDYVPYDDSDMRFIKDGSLIELIANRPDDVERIAEIVLQHGTSNAAAINGILEGALPPVAEGYL